LRLPHSFFFTSGVEFEKDDVPVLYGVVLTLLPETQKLRSFLTKIQGTRGTVNYKNATKLESYYLVTFLSENVPCGDHKIII
jgi:hypothetical protein